MPKPSDLAAALEPVRQPLAASGLWMAYKDVAALIGRPNAYRAIANLNWDTRVNSRMARVDGTSDSRVHPDRSRVWNTEFTHSQWSLVDRALGYPGDGKDGFRKPEALRASVSDGRQLLGEEPLSGGLKRRLDRNLERLRNAEVAWFTEEGISTPEPLVAAIRELAALVGHLET